MKKVIEKLYWLWENNVMTCRSIGRWRISMWVSDTLLELLLIAIYREHRILNRRIQKLSLIVLYGSHRGAGKFNGLNITKGVTNEQTKNGISNDISDSIHNVDPSDGVDVG